MNNQLLIYRNNKIKNCLAKWLLLFCIISNCSYKVQAQSRSAKNKVMNLENYDQRRIHFGFLIAANIADFRIKYNPKYGTDSVISVLSKRESGFNLGIVTDLRLAEHFNLRFIPTLSFSTRILQYQIIENKELKVLEKPVESIYMDMPLLFKFKSDRVGNFRAYLIAGGRYSIDMASEKDINSNLISDILVKVDKSDFMIEFGIGFDLYLTYFKLSPEIKYSFGLKNILVQEQNALTSPLNSLTSRILQISFNLE